MAQLDKLTGSGFRVIGEPLTWLRVGYLGIKGGRIYYLSVGRTLLPVRVYRFAISWIGGVADRAVAWWVEKRSRRGTQERPS